MSPRSAGARQARRERERRRRRRLGLLAFFAVSAACTGLILGAAWLGNRSGAGPQVAVSESPTSAPVAQQQDTLLLIRHGASEGPALGITLLGVDTGGNAVVLFLPVGTLVDIPGFGLDRLGLAHQYGGPALVEASVENLLGIAVDHVAAASDSALAALLARTEGLKLDVATQLVARGEAGAAQVRFEPGAQFLDGERLVEYWGFVQRGEQELSSFPRQQEVWTALLDAAQEPDVVDAMVSDGAPQLETSAGTEFLRSMISGLAEAQADKTLGFSLLPVAPFGEEDESGVTYRPTEGAVSELATGALAGSVPAGGGVDAIRVQVLNGVGTPGIGEQVDRRLEGAGVRVVLTDNARSFDFARTRILVYSEDDASLAAAELVQQRLGVGTIQISRQPQSVVDLTIVVGADFTAAEPGGAAPTESEEQSS